MAHLDAPDLLRIPARGLHVGHYPLQPALYLDLPLPCHRPSYWLRLFSSQIFSCIHTPTFLKPSHSSYLPAYVDGTDRVFETSAYKFQSLGNYPEESIQQGIKFFLCQLVS